MDGGVSYEDLLSDCVFQKVLLMTNFTMARNAVGQLISYFSHYDFKCVAKECHHRQSAQLMILSYDQDLYKTKETMEIKVTNKTEKGSAKT